MLAGTENVRKFFERLTRGPEARRLLEIFVCNFWKVVGPATPSSVKDRCSDSNACSRISGSKTGEVFGVKLEKTTPLKGYNHPSTHIGDFSVIETFCTRVRITSTDSLRDQMSNLLEWKPEMRGNRLESILINAVCTRSFSSKEMSDTGDGTVSLLVSSPLSPPLEDIE